MKRLKLSSIAKEVMKQYDNKKLAKQDLYELYRDKYIEYEELKAIEVRR